MLIVSWCGVVVCVCGGGEENNGLVRFEEGEKEGSADLGAKLKASMTGARGQ